MSKVYQYLLDAIRPTGSKAGWLFKAGRSASGLHEQHLPITTRRKNVPGQDSRRRSRGISSMTIIQLSKCLPREWGRELGE